jgi:hypothetical protein
MVQTILGGSARRDVPTACSKLSSRNTQVSFSAEKALRSSAWPRRRRSSEAAQYRAAEMRQV